MKQMLPILTITGSDGTGASGIQADIRAITALGGHALTALTSVTVQDSHGISSIHDLDGDVVLAQTRALMSDLHPRGVKVGMVRQSNVMRALRNLIVGCPHIVSAPGVIDSHGQRLMDDVAVSEFVRTFLPETEVLVTRCSEAEIITGQTVRDEASMLDAARWLLARGCKAVLLRGGHCSEGLLTALLMLEGRETEPRFFTSPNTEGWQLHGVGGTLSSAITTRLALGDDVEQAISRAHQYMRSQVVYSAESASYGVRQVELYNRLMQLVAQHYRTCRDVAFYAEQLHVTTRYLSEVTGRVAGRATKQLISDYVMHEIERRLSSTSLTIQEIAVEYGFGSQAALAKFFRKQRGCSPSEFRQDQ